MSNKFGECIRNARKAEGLTLKDISDLIQMSQSFVSMVENGKTIPPLHVILDLAQILDIRKNKLLQLIEEDRAVRQQEIQQNMQELNNELDEVIEDDVSSVLTKTVQELSELTKVLTQLVSNIKPLIS